MSRTGSSYEIARPTGRCAATGDPLEPGDECISCLIEREEDEGFDRVDFSSVGWETAERPKRLFSHWRARVPEPNQKQRVFVDDELLVNIFERLEGDERSQRVAFRFVLALVLMRKKILRYVAREERGADEVWILKPKAPAGTEVESIEVINPRLSEEDAQEVSDQLGEILNGDLE